MCEIDDAAAEWSAKHEGLILTLKEDGCSRTEILDIAVRMVRQLLNEVAALRAQTLAAGEFEEREETIREIAVTLLEGASDLLGLINPMAEERTLM